MIVGEDDRSGRGAFLQVFPPSLRRRASGYGSIPVEPRIQHSSLVLYAGRFQASVRGKAVPSFNAGDAVGEHSGFTRRDETAAGAGGEIDRKNPGRSVHQRLEGVRFAGERFTLGEGL